MGFAEEKRNRVPAIERPEVVPLLIPPTLGREWRVTRPVSPEHPLPRVDDLADAAAHGAKKRMRADMNPEVPCEVPVPLQT